MRSRTLGAKLSSLVVVVCLGIAGMLGLHAQEPPAQPTEWPSQPTVPPQPTKTADAKNSDVRQWFQYGAEASGGFVGYDSLLDQSQLYLLVVPNVAYETTRWAVGSAARLSRYDFGNVPIDRARLEVDGSLQFGLDCPEKDKGGRNKLDTCDKKLRIIGYVAKEDTNVSTDEVLDPEFDPNGQTEYYGAQLRLRRQDGKGGSMDGIFVRPEKVWDVLVGGRHYREQAKGEALSSSGWTGHFDLRIALPSADPITTRGVIGVGLAYTKADFATSPSIAAHGDKIWDVTLGYSLQLFQRQAFNARRATVGPPGRWDLLAAFHHNDTQSDAAEFDSSRNVVTLGIRFCSQVSHDLGGAGPRKSPADENASTTSPSDLGPKQPLLGGGR